MTSERGCDVSCVDWILANSLFLTQLLRSAASGFVWPWTKLYARAFLCMSCHNLLPAVLQECSAVFDTTLFSIITHFMMSVFMKLKGCSNSSVCSTAISSGRHNFPSEGRRCKTNPNLIHEASANQLQQYLVLCLCCPEE